MTDINIQKANENSLFGKNMTFKNLFLSNFKQKPLADLNSGSAVQKTNALDH